MRYEFTRKGQPRGWVETWDGIVVLTSPGFEWAYMASAMVIIDWAVGKFASTASENKEYVHNPILFASARAAHATKMREARRTYFPVDPPPIAENEND